MIDCKPQRGPCSCVCHNHPPGVVSHFMACCNPSFDDPCYDESAGEVCAPEYPSDKDLRLVGINRECREYLAKKPRWVREFVYNAALRWLMESEGDPNSYTITLRALIYEFGE